MNYRVIVAGGREFNDPLLLERILLKHIEPSDVLVCGMARGADRMAWNWAAASGILIDEHPADWEAYGKAAGVRRNREMADVADVLVAFWDGKSPGTRDMINAAIHRGLEVHIYRYTNV